MLRRALLVAVVMVFPGCPQPVVGNTGGGSGTGTGGEGGSGGSGGSGGEGGGMDTFAQSAKANVRFKKAVRLTNDLANALGLPADQLCKEFGQYQCATFVHTVPLGGTDPYGAGLYEPLPFTSMTSPIVTDRVALSGCMARTAADLATPAAAVIWKEVSLDGSGKLDVDAPAVATAIDLLYKRALLRPPTTAEVGHLKQLYKDIDATGKPEVGKSFMTLSCFAVLTTVEALFY